MTERRRGAVRSEKARLAILNATAAQLAERGWDQLTIEGIAADAGVGKPTIYRWWPSKSALVADALLEGAIVLPTPLPADTGDLRADLVGWLEPTLGLTENPEATALTRYLVAAAAEDAVVGHRLDEANPATRLLAERLAVAQERGELASTASIELIIDALIGAFILRALRRAPYQPGQAAALVDAVLFEQLGTAAARD
ncbi:TetR/AcrR family transcriptional regulator [Agromyces sp. NPDC057679]|uniref:TetR/AcrR family transcriptional regulator n=1 Tax=Agromyces sp. NPDC057679 TaxID=3346207 RepID=UPI00366F59CC